MYVICISEKLDFSLQMIDSNRIFVIKKRNAENH